jgi:hypothetical protein
MGKSKQIYDGKIAVGLLSTALLFTMLYRSPNSGGDLIAICIDIFLIAFTIVLGISSLCRSTGTDRKCGVIALFLAVLLTTWVILSAMFN